MKQYFVEVRPDIVRRNRCIYTFPTVANKCSPNPCKNGGVCFEENNDYVCNCPQGFKGKTCEGQYWFTMVTLDTLNFNWSLKLKQKRSP